MAGRATRWAPSSHTRPWQYPVLAHRSIIEPSPLARGKHSTCIELLAYPGLWGGSPTPEGRDSHPGHLRGIRTLLTLGHHYPPPADLGWAIGWEPTSNTNAFPPDPPTLSLEQTTERPSAYSTCPSWRPQVSPSPFRPWTKRRLVLLVVVVQYCSSYLLNFLKGGVLIVFWRLISLNPQCGSRSMHSQFL